MMWGVVRWQWPAFLGVALQGVVGVVLLVGSRPLGRALHRLHQGGGDDGPAAGEELEEGA